MDRKKADIDRAVTPARKGEPNRKYIRGASGTNPLDKNFKHEAGGVAEVLGSDGIHEKVLIHRAPTEENLERWFSSDTPEAFWNDIKQTLERCDQIMLEHGWDRKAGNGRNFPGDRQAEPFSQLWYAGQIGQTCWALLTFSKPENPETWILRRVLGLGIDVAEADWRLTFRPAILTGQKQRKTLQECRDKANSASKLAVDARRDAVSIMLVDTKLTKGALHKYLRKRLFDEMGMTVSSRTLRRDLEAIRDS